MRLAGEIRHDRLCRLILAALLHFDQQLVQFVIVGYSVFVGDRRLVQLIELIHLIGLLVWSSNEGGLFIAFLTTVQLLLIAIAD